MEWLILLLLVPAILVPVVLLFGFTGCHFHPVPVDPNPTQPPTVMAPTVTPVPKNIDHITVSWQNTDPNPVVDHYHFVRLKGTQTQPDFQTDTTDTSRDDTGLETATDYTYQVSTTTADGTSDVTTAPTRTFQPAFEVTAAPTPQGWATSDYCFVQRISAGRLLAGGSQVGIKVHGGPNSNVTIHRIYISQVATGKKPYDPAGDLTKVMDSTQGDPPLMLPNDQPVDLDPIPYNLDKSQDLLIAFDFTAAVGSDTIAYFLPESGVTLYFKQGVQEAAAPTRGSGYSGPPGTNPEMYLVEKIGVP